MYCEIAAHWFLSDDAIRVLTDLIILTKSQDSSTGRFCSGCHMTEIFWLMNQQINYNLLKRRKNDLSRTAVLGNTAVIATGIEYRLRFDSYGHEFDVQFFGPPCGLMWQVETAECITSFTNVNGSLGLCYSDIRLLMESSVAHPNVKKTTRDKNLLF